MCLHYYYALHTFTHIQYIHIYIHVYRKSLIGTLLIVSRSLVNNVWTCVKHNSSTGTHIKILELLTSCLELVAWEIYVIIL